MANIKTAALDLHKQLAGKIQVENKVQELTVENLSLLYSPGVAAPCEVIAQDEKAVYDYTWKGNTIAVVSNGSAVLGLGDIGPAAGLPVMEGKSFLFKAFAGVNAIPLVIDTADPAEIIRFCELIAPTFGGINLEDIKAPDCVYIEETLKERLSIPVFHDDQHGTAVVTLAGLINAYRYLEKDLTQAKVVVSGTGAAGSAIIKMLHRIGINEIYGVNSSGVINPATPDLYNSVVQALCPILSAPTGPTTLAEILVGADIFIGVSAANLVSAEMVKTMAKDAVVFALANPDPEIPYGIAKAAGAKIVATGRSDYPNQINNVLAFPGIFKGILAARAPKITVEMQIAAAHAIAEMVSDAKLAEDYIVPNALNSKVADQVAQAIIDQVEK